MLESLDLILDVCAKSKKNSLAWLAQQECVPVFFS